MPELPEVETTRQSLIPYLLQQTISGVKIRNYHLRWPIPRHLPKILQGKKIINIDRRGKYLLLKTNTGAIIFHLGMSGHLRILPHYSPFYKHDHVDILFANKQILRFTDPRRFGALLWIEEDINQHKLFKNLGVEPLTKEFSVKYLSLYAQRRIVSIKSLLMNNNIITGIGNIYANEALFKAGIYPAMPSKYVSYEKLNKLVKAVKYILKRAIYQGGTTLKDFMSSEGRPGYFSHYLNVYGRAGMPCKNCESLLSTIRIAQRSTVYCKNCQSFDPKQSV